MESAGEEEMMALESIFYDSFNKIADNKFRVRIDPSEGEVDQKAACPPPLFVEVLLPDLYPQEAAVFDISNINNSSYPDFVKKAILHGLQEQASDLIGESMCYTVLEWLKDKLPELYSMKPISVAEDLEDLTSTRAQDDLKDMSGARKENKEKLTKSQKRRYFNKFGATSEKPRGWDWVSIISHLSQVPQHGPTMYVGLRTISGSSPH